MVAEEGERRIFDNCSQGFDKFADEISYNVLHSWSPDSGFNII